MPIVKLDEITIEQIAAGEVIESPVSIVKELVENSIDAGAYNITVEIKNGGKSYIRVTDDGSGINPDEMELAFEKHATSKIHRFEDLYDIYSLGFRGEALASIVTVSDVTAISKDDASNLGKKLTFKANQVTGSKIATNTGTSIEVSDLFKNIPVRYKFLKSDIAETNAITKLMYSFAIGYKDIAFKYIKDNRIEFKTNKNEELRDRIANLLDDNLKDNLLEINKSNDIYKIEGFVSSSNYYRGSRNLQYIYVNDRLIDSSLLIKSIEEEYRSFIPNGRFPAVFLFITTHPKNLDVNVHPNKKTIKFNYEDELISLLKGAIYEALNQNISPNKITIEDDYKEDMLNFSDYGKLLESYKKSQQVREESSSYDDFFSKDLEISTIDTTEINKVDIAKESKNFLNPIDSYSYLTSIFAKYSIFAHNDKIVILNNRRADEAIKFDRFIKEFNLDNVASQMLLEPIIVDLKYEDIGKFKEKSSDINRLGFDIDMISDNKIIIRSIPLIFDKPESNDIFYSLLDIDYTDTKEIIYDKLYKLIKKNSFRKGNPVNEKEAISLLEKVLTLTNPYKTFEGKAIMVSLEEEEMEKYFDR